jgi:hypothetical protein
MAQSNDTLDGFTFDMPPHLMSRAQQAFGPYNPDSTSVPPVLPASLFGDGNDQIGLDENDPKRRRIARVSA